MRRGGGGRPDEGAGVVQVQGPSMDVPGAWRDGGWEWRAPHMGSAARGWWDDSRDGEALHGRGGGAVAVGRGA